MNEKPSNSNPGMPVAIDPTVDLDHVIIDRLLNQRGAIDALAVLVCRMYSQVMHVDLETVDKEYTELQNDFFLRHAFRFETDYGLPPETPET